MRFTTVEKYPYARIGKDYGITPKGEVIFLNKDLPEEIKKRLIEDVKRDWEERMNPKTVDLWEH